ncbi:MAG: PhpK family radical SAM P-methyltransferase, partial [bacterium]|nr:PhpK family radical SAM P-methyltransferase [bacterium]
MNKKIDCLFIGHNEMSFVEYEKSVREMGTHSGAYRDLEKNFIRSNNIPYHASEIFNTISGRDNGAAGKISPLTMGDTFNLAVAYLGTYLHRRQLTFDYVNAFQDQKEELAEKLSSEDILTIAIITTLYVSVFPILEIVEFVKKYNKTARIIIGGPFMANQVRNLPPMELQYLLKTIGADFYVNSSQGEAALVKIIKALKNDLPPDEIHNIYYKKEGQFCGTPLLRENNRLSENMVDWTLFADRITENINVRTSISCPFACTFCGFPEHAGKYQTAEVGDIEQEFDRIKKIEKVKSVHFIDDTFNVPVKRFKEILRMMIRNNYKFRWHSHFRCQFADRETVALMKESGCEGVFLGIESGSDRILKIMNKAAKVRDYLEGVKLLKEYGILTYGSFIIGFPGETGETVQETITFIKESGIDFYRAQLWYCDTMTPIWKEREKYGINGSQFEWQHNTFDSKKACDIADDIFLSVEDPIWIPQYNFEFDGLFHILQRDIPLDRAKRFIKAFNNGIKEKITNSLRQEAGFDVIRELELSLAKTDHPAELYENREETISETDGE